MFEDNLTERLELALERTEGILAESEGCSDNFAEYFKKEAEFILYVESVRRLRSAGTNPAFDLSLDELKKVYDKLYASMRPEAYDQSVLNPSYAVELMGEEYGQLFSFVALELYSLITLGFQNRMGEYTAVIELFLELYCSFEWNAESGEVLIPEYKSLKNIVYWYVSDYSDEFVEYRVREQIDPACDFATRIITESDLSDLRYLYSYGEYVGDNELRMAEYMNSLPQSDIDSMAMTFVEGYRKGFEVTRKDISKKKTVNIRYCLGFERLVRREIELFEKIGLKATIYPAAVNSINKRMHIKVGYYGCILNKQMEFDHRFDNAIYLDAAFVERKLGALKLAYEKNAQLADEFGGPAVMEVFGEVPFEPSENEAALKLDARQRKLSARYDSEAGAITNMYIKGEERSFTIIAYPVPEIGDNFEEIFKETVAINTLDYDKYMKIQQCIIDTLDGSDYVSIKGKGDNCTDLNVKIMKLDNPESQTSFENCVADVNIPLGEVFTSPVLEGTEGVLNVSQVYLNDLCFKNLRVSFKDGMVDKYSCDNFEDEKMNMAFFKENVLYNHESLPMGEFAIGTNTTAYSVARRYDILNKLPILIVEKMGPHFAVGDTCYSHAEDVSVYNQDGKEIMARDNSVSLLRRTEPEKAYFNCHTDITIPYDEIGLIEAVKLDGSRVAIIEDGRFVLKGCEELNAALDFIC